MKTMGVLFLLLGFSGLFAESIILFWHHIFGSDLFVWNRLSIALMRMPGLYSALNLIWVKGLIVLAISLPFIWFIYTGLQCIIDFKVPKWHPGLVIVIVWLLTLIMLSVTVFMGCIPTIV